MLALSCATIGGAFAGGVVAAFTMFVAWQHNPQGEFQDAGAVHWAWIELGLLHFGLCAALGALVGAVRAFIVRNAAD